MLSCHMHDGIRRREAIFLVDGKGRKSDNQEKGERKRKGRERKMKKGGGGRKQGSKGKRKSQGMTRVLN